MTPKERAKELVDRFINITPCNDNELSEDEMHKEQLHSAKQCALICVDEILEECLDIKESYWQEVKEEIKEL